MKINRLPQRSPLLSVLGVVLLLWGGGLTAQRSTVYIQNDTVPLTSDTIVVAVRCINFDSIVGVSFTMNWDSTLLSFAGVREEKLEGSNNFTSHRASSGWLGYLGIDNAIEGYGVADSSVMFTVSFLPLTTVTTTTQVTLTDSLADRVLTRLPNTQVMDADFLAGTLLLEGATSITTVAEDASFRVHPNPVADVSQIEANLNYTSPATLDVLDASGRMLNQRRVMIHPGRNTFSLNAVDLPRSGTYVIRLTTERERLTRKVIRR